jgi:hypothetical protein
MAEVLALGQREVELGMEYTAEEAALMRQNGVLPREVEEFVRTSGKQTINAAIAGIMNLKSGRAGQVRNEPFQAQAEADAQVSGSPSPEQKEQAAEIEPDVSHLAAAPKEEKAAGAEKVGDTKRGKK